MDPLALPDSPAGLTGRTHACLARGPTSGQHGEVPATVTVKLPPTGAAFDIVLMAHVASAIIGFGALVTTGVQAARARRGPGAPGAEGVRRYFRPGINWMARALYGVPVFGLALVAMSQGSFAMSDHFVDIGLGLWLAATLLAEIVVWPGERRLQQVVSSGWGDAQSMNTLEHTGRAVALAAAGLGCIFVVAVVVMFAKP